MSDDPNKPEGEQPNGDTPAPSSDKGDPAGGSDTPQSHMIPKARLDEESAKRKAAETSLAEVAEAVLAEVPEKFRDLIPDGLTPADKIKWFTKAKATGVFASEAKVPETDSGKAKSTPKDRSYSDMSAGERIAAGYGKKD